MHFRKTAFVSLRILFGCVVLSAVLFCEPAAAEGDWPMWRYDAGRIAATPNPLPAELHLQWTRQLPPPKPSFPEESRLCFDSSYEPVVMGKAIYVPSMVDDSLTAFDTDTGTQRWKFYADGPVRFAPIAWKDKVYFVSDDGYLYCLDAKRGSLLWKFSGAGHDRKGPKLLGNERLISRWPARGGPVLADGTIYFAAGIFPSEGVFIHALNARTGKPVWSNKGSGLIEKSLLDHNTYRDGGLSPQGYLAVIGDRLIVPSGKALPGIFARKTGKLEPYISGWGGRKTKSKGSWYVSATGKYFFQSGDLYDATSRTRLLIDTGANDKELGQFREPVLTSDAIYYSIPVNERIGDSYKPYGMGYDGILACQITEAAPEKKTTTLKEIWRFDSNLQVHIKAGPRLYAGSRSVVAAIDIPEQDAQPALSWETKIEGTPYRMLAADDKLFVVTGQGRIYCFGGEAVKPKTYAMKKPPLNPPTDRWAKKAHRILSLTGATEGYCLALGVGSGRLIEELARRSTLHIIAVDTDSDRVNAVRSKLSEIGLYGSRIHILKGDLESIQLPPYIVSLVVSENLADFGPQERQAKAFIDKHYSLLHPHGGVACLDISAKEHTALAGWIAKAKPAGAELKRVDNFTLLTRTGALPGSADWTHENSDAGNTFASLDRLVKPPLGILWFGGSIDRIFPDWDFTHSRGPSPLVVDSRMFILVGNTIHASDIYTGRHLWQVDIAPQKNKRRSYRYNNYVAVDDGVYVVSGNTCLRLDPENGAQLGQIRIPQAVAQEKPVNWNEIRISKDYLIGTAGKWLLCVNRYNGRLLWKIESQKGLFSLAVGDDKVFLVDYLLPDKKELTEITDSVVALDLRTGDPLWQKAVKASSEKPFKPGKPQLTYCDRNDTLILTMYERAVFACSGSDGDLLWNKNLPGCTGPPILQNGRLITYSGQMYEPTTGDAKPQRLWNGVNANWASGGVRGCGRAVASEHLVTIRDAHVSYYDLVTSTQTHFRGIRSGCTNSVIPAGGLLNAPNFARGCACNYSIFTSVGWVHIPEAATWQ